MRMDDKHLENRKEERKKGLEINDNFDFIFAAKLHPALRWALVLPMGIAGLLAVQFCLGWIASMLLKSFGANLANIVNGILGIIKCMVLLMSMVATAPVARKNKLRTCLALAIVPFAAPLCLQYILRKEDMEIAPVWMAVNYGLTAVGVVITLLAVRSTTKKPVVADSTALAEMPTEDLSPRSE